MRFQVSDNGHYWGDTAPEELEAFGIPAVGGTPPYGVYLDLRQKGVAPCYSLNVYGDDEETTELFEQELNEQEGAELLVRIARRRQAQELGPIRASLFNVDVTFGLTTSEHDAIRALGVPVGPRVQRPVHVWLKS